MKLDKLSPLSSHQITDSISCSLYSGTFEKEKWSSARLGKIYKAGYHTILFADAIPQSDAGIYKIIRKWFGFKYKLQLIQEIRIATAPEEEKDKHCGGGILYVQSGALKYRGSSGTVL